MSVSWSSTATAELQRDGATRLPDAATTALPLLVTLADGELAKRPHLEQVVAAHARRVCLADAGDMWVYSPPILHASERATRPRRRRVVQVDYAASALPPGLDWIGVA